MEKLQVITVHSPELEHEKDISLLADKIKAFELEYPVLVDNEFKYWDSINSAGWPSFYLVDKEGKFRFSYLGETHSYFAQARDIEKNLSLLLEE